MRDKRVPLVAICAIAFCLGSSTSSAQGYSVRCNGPHRIEVGGTQKLVSLHREFTAEMLVRWNPTPMRSRLFGTMVVDQGRHSGWEIYAELKQGLDMNFPTFAGSSGSLIHPRTVADTPWHHIAATRDADGWMSYWIDGKTFGGGKSTDYSKVDQEISNISLGASALSNKVVPSFQDIKAFRISAFTRYTATFEPPNELVKDAQTAVLLDFEHPQPNRIFDLSGNGYHGILVGAVWIESETGNPLTARQMPGMSTAKFKSLYGLVDRSKPEPPKTQSVPPAFGPPATAAIPMKAADKMASVVAKDLATASATAAKANDRGEPPTLLKQLDEEALADGILETESIFATEIADAKTTEEKISLAKQIYNKQVGVKDDLAKVALLHVACLIAGEAGDYDFANECTSAIESLHYDAMDLRIESMRKLGDAAKRSTEREKVLTQSLEYAKDALTQGRIDEAIKFAKIARSQVSKYTKTTLTDPLLAIEQDGDFAMKRKRLAELARNNLVHSPKNSRAYLAVGRYEAFILRDWDAGLKNLMLGSSEVLKDAATLDIESRDDVQKAVESGDAWWNAAEIAQGIEQRSLRWRAVYQYSRVKQQLKGLEKLRIEKRLSELD